MIIVIILV